MYIKNKCFCHISENEMYDQSSRNQEIFQPDMSCVISNLGYCTCSGPCISKHWHSWNWGRRVKGAIATTPPPHWPTPILLRHFALLIVVLGAPSPPLLKSPGYATVNKLCSVTSYCHWDKHWNSCIWLAVSNFFLLTIAINYNEFHEMGTMVSVI